MSYYSIKNCSLEIKDISEKDGIVSGYLSTFGFKDSDGDIIQKGAFTRTVTERGPQGTKARIKHLLDHKTDKVIGVFQELKEDSQGLYYVSKLGNHTLGQDALHMYSDGIITEHSIGFNIIHEKSEKESNIITEVKLWEGSSLQTWGANENTPVLGVKGIDKKPEEYLDRIDRINSALRKGKYTDETFELLEIELKQIQELIKGLLNKDTSINENLNSIENANEINLAFKRNLERWKLKT